MSGQHGGYRKPANPAPVSGPGAHSQRTDGKQPVMDLPNAAYGENAQFRQDQAGAAVPSQPDLLGRPAPGLDLSGLTGLGVPTQQASTPVTDGAQYGAGRGPSVLGGQPDANRQDAQFLSKYLPALVDITSSENTPPGARAYVRLLFANS